MLILLSFTHYSVNGESSINGKPGGVDTVENLRDFARLMPRKRHIGSGPIERAIAMFETQSALAREAHVPQQEISLASRTGHVSARLAIAIHRATKGRVGAHLLRPDLWRNAKAVPVGRRNGP